LAELHGRKQIGRLHDGLVLAPSPDHAHSELGVRLAAILGEAATGAKGPTQRQTGADAAGPGAGREPAPNEPRTPPPRLQAPVLQEPGSGTPPRELERALAARDEQIRQLRLEAKGRASEISILNQR